MLDIMIEQENEANKLADLLYDKVIKCINCGQSFKTKRMRVNSVRMQTVDTDFCPHYLKENPIYYDVNVCPHCGLAFTDSFSPIIPVLRENLEKEYLTKIRSPQLCDERSWDDALRSYELAFLSSRILREKLLIQANLALRIAWLYRYQSRKAEEKRFLEYAVTLYVNMYETQDYDEEVMPDAKLMYIIGELFGRLEQWEKTRIWFSHLFMDKAADQKWRTRGRDRWLEYKNHQSNLEDPDGYAGVR